MTDHQFQAILAWLTRIHLQQETIVRDIAAIRRWHEPILFAPEPTIEGHAFVTGGGGDTGFAIVTIPKGRT